MSVHKIPVNKLSAEALQGVIEEFISRGGTDYGAIEAFQETKFRQVKYMLESGLAVPILMTRPKQRISFWLRIRF